MNCKYSECLSMLKSCVVTDQKLMVDIIMNLVSGPNHTTFFISHGKYAVGYFLLGELKFAIHIFMCIINGVLNITCEKEKYYERGPFYF